MYTQADVIAGLEFQLKGAKEQEEFTNKVKKLIESPLFREVIVQGFCKDECSRYVHMSCDSQLTEQERADALGIAQAAGHLKRFLAVTLTKGEAAISSIEELERALDDARAQPDEE